MTVFEINSRLLIVDCGVLFPEESQPGVDLILPDFGYIRNRLDDIDGLVLTHAHEDHVGALPYLLRERQDIPIYGSKLTLGLVSAKLREHRMKPELTEVAAGGSEKIGNFDVEFVAVNHSIPDALAVAIDTPAGRVLHTGDFKMDQLPLDGRITDLNSFARLGDEGVDLFLVDSTNAEVPGFVTSEQKIAPVMDEVFAKAPGRLIVGCFASHIHRVQQVINAAVAHNRRVAFVGRSMVRTMNVAKDLGYLKIPGGVLVSVDQLDELPDDQVVMVCTGSQGEPMAALARIANRDHKIRVHDQDTVLLASSVIPGNENSINRVINGLSRWGVNVIHTGNALVHVSGHAAAGELLYVYNIVKPANVMPVHGEVRHLIANAELAVAAGVDPDHVILAEDGTAIDLKDGVAKIVGRVPCGYVFVDGSSVGELSEGLLKDRRILSEEGFVSVFVAVDISEGKIVAGPEIAARGFAEGGKVFDDVVPKIVARVEEAMADGVTDSYQLQQLIRRTTGKWVGERLRRRPMIVPVVVEA
ncbi:MAG: ribonuclease J [Actinobacteria bacterium]|nr:ribonuclease J [Actinomycetota bacterium]